MVTLLYFCALMIIEKIDWVMIMKELTIKSIVGVDYRVYIDSTIDKFHNALDENKVHQNDKLFIVVDINVYNIYKDSLDKLVQQYKCKYFYCPSGKKNKNINTVQMIYNFLIENNANRNSILIALGGGVVGDLVGFVASTYMRGIRYINMPTTLLSQVDSCIGGKCGYDYGNIENVIGSFYNPCFVYISTSFLKTLKDREFKSGIGEVVKYGTIKNKELLSFINDNYKRILEKENDKLLYIVKECLNIKYDIIKEDYNDTGIRNILNFGYIIGHGIEVYSNFTLSHGEAVALGILATMKLSENKLDMPQTTYNKIRDIYIKIGLPIKYKVDNKDLFMNSINHDRKNNENVNMVLLQDLENYKINVPVTNEDILRAVKGSIHKGE